MKYSCSVDIRQTLEKVVELFDNPENWPHWQPGLISVEHLSGVARQTNARSKLQYKVGKRDLDLIEIVVKRDLPKEYIATYETKGIFHTVRSLFAPIDQNNTRFVTEQEYQFSGYMKWVRWFRQGAFKKETLNYMTRFKLFVESR